MNAMVRAKRKLQDLECIMYLFEFVHFSESKRKQMIFYKRSN